MNALVNRKKLIIFIFLFFLIGSFFTFKRVKNETKKTHYILGRVEKGAIIVSVSGSGQISASDQIDIKSKISGEVEEIFVEKDQKVKKGDLLLKFRTKDFETSINDAKLALDNAKIALDNLKRKIKNLKDDLKEAYESAFNNLSTTFNDLPQTINALEEIFTKSSYGSSQSDLDYYRSIIGFYSGQTFSESEMESRFLKLKEKYETLRNNYLFLSKNPPPEVLEEWIDRTSKLVKEISDLVREGKEIISFYKEKISDQKLIPPISLSITENQFSSLSIILSSLDQKYSILSSSSKTINQLKESISDLQDQINLQGKLVAQKENSLEKAIENYENCFVKSPFDGKIVKVNIKKGDSVSTITPLFTLISEKKIAEVSLNEIDAVKVKLGQKATLTFDALPDLTLTGKVTEVDTVGTVSQGVVSYTVKIALDSDDERIKPSMSVTAEIIVDSKTDILVLPNSAIKTRGNLKYVELIDAPEELKKKLKIGSQITLPKEIEIKNQIVETGISNESVTEIISGLKEDDIVIFSKISPQTTIQRETPQTQFRFQIPGIGGRVIR